VKCSEIFDDDDGYAPRKTMGEKNSYQCRIAILQSHPRLFILEMRPFVAVA
jgi:hypothetical protein